MERKNHERRGKLGGRALVVGLAGVALVTVIDNKLNPVTVAPGNERTHQMNDGSTDPGVNFRTSPLRREGGGDTENNSCAQPNTAIHFSGRVVINENLRSGSQSGEWVGIPLESLPENLQEQCEDGQDGKAWVAREYVNEG